MGDRRSACRVSVGQPEGQRPLQRHKNRKEDNKKKMIFKKDNGGLGLD